MKLAARKNLANVSKAVDLDVVVAAKHYVSK